MAGITIHPSVANIDLEGGLAVSLRANRLDPKLLYVTRRQAELWREVHLKHSPIHTNPEFTRIYRDAFNRTAEELHAGKIHVVGLGPGTGLKEAELVARLRSYGRDVRFTAIDVSRNLVEEASRCVVAAGGAAERHLVCDLAEVEYIKGWLDVEGWQTPRLFTFFGLAPNLEPEFVANLPGQLLRPGDVLLASVHLAPIGEGVELAAAMEIILPQYSNAETLAWLRAAMEEWKLDALMERPEIIAETNGQIPRIRGQASWLAPESVPFELFFSLRYTPELFDGLLREAGVECEMLAITACREEAIWAVRRD